MASAFSFTRITFVGWLLYYEIDTMLCEHAASGINCELLRRCVGTVISDRMMNDE